MTSVVNFLDSCFTHEHQPVELFVWNPAANQTNKQTDVGERCRQHRWPPDLFSAYAPHRQNQFKPHAGRAFKSNVNKASNVITDSRVVSIITIRDFPP